MNDLKSFSFYKNYYELLKYLPNEDRLSLYDAIFNYMFEDLEPNFSDLKNGIWVNLKMPLDTSKNNAGRGGRPTKKEVETKTDTKPIENRLKTDKETDLKTNNIFLFLISNFLFLKDRGLLRGKIEEWLEYKKQRKDKPYTEIGFKKLLKQIENNVNEYGEQAVIDLIDDCMSNNYQGIIFDKLKNRKNTYTQEKETPNWFDKNQDVQIMSKQEEEQIKSLLTEMGVGYEK